MLNSSTREQGIIDHYVAGGMPRVRRYLAISALSGLFNLFVFSVKGLGSLARLGYRAFFKTELENEISDIQAQSQGWNYTDAELEALRAVQVGGEYTPSRELRLANMRCLDIMAGIDDDADEFQPFSEEDDDSLEFDEPKAPNKHWW